MHTACMNLDARLTIYGGAAIGTAVLALGVVTSPVLEYTALGIMGATLVVAVAFDHILPA